MGAQLEESEREPNNIVVFRVSFQQIYKFSIQKQKTCIFGFQMKCYFFYSADGKIGMQGFQLVGGQDVKKKTYLSKTGV
jgi:hypothetical protein